MYAEPSLEGGRSEGTLATPELGDQNLKEGSVVCPLPVPFIYVFKS